MAPKPPGGSKGPSKGAGASKGAKGKTSRSGAAPSNKKSNASAKRPPTKQLRTKPEAHNPTKPKKKQRVYSDKELGLPALNTVTPAGVQKSSGKKKGKIFVDDQESMMTILAIVNAEKEGQIESKMMKARAMEEIREARRKEAEARHERKNEKLEETKQSVKRSRQSKGKRKTDGAAKGHDESFEDTAPVKRSKKRVSFA